MATLSLSEVPENSGQAQYFREIWRYPLLEREEEQMLAIRLRDQGDIDAAHQLVISHLRLVAKIAMKYRNYGLPVADLISEGSIGLMKAVRKFDPDRQFRLSTYAMWWIKAAIVEHILQSWSLVKMGTVASQKRLFFSLRRIKERLNILDNGELSPEQALRLSEATDMPIDDVIHMNQRLSVRDLSLNAPLSRAEGAGDLLELLVDEKPLPEASLGDHEEKELRRRILANAIADLPERQRHIFTARRLCDDRPTLKQLGAEYGITHERVRQIEAQAFKRVKEFITDRISAGTGRKVSEGIGLLLMNGA